MQKIRKTIVKSPRQSALVAGLDKQLRTANSFTTKVVNEVKQMKKEAEANKDAAFTAKYRYPYNYRRVEKLQRQLADAELYNSAIDGDWGPSTDSAWTVYSAQDSNNFPGIQISLIPVDRFGRITPECATYSNTLMRSLGLKASGHSYQVGSNYTPVINGYDGMSLFPTLSETRIMDQHRQAADNVMHNLDTSLLRKNHLYPVNMYYAGSKHMRDFYNRAVMENTRTPGTHTGVLYNNTNQWMVAHNISTNVHNEPVSEVLGGRSNPNKYGITAVYDAGAIKGHPDKKEPDKKEKKEENEGLFGLGFFGL